MICHSTRLMRTYTLTHSHTHTLTHSHTHTLKEKKQKRNATASKQPTLSKFQFDRFDSIQFNAIWYRFNWIQHQFEMNWIGSISFQIVWLNSIRFNHRQSIQTNPIQFVIQLNRWTDRPKVTQRSNISGYIFFQCNSGRIRSFAIDWRIAGDACDACDVRPQNATLPHSQK